MKWGGVLTGLLASSSLAALAIGAGAPPAFAACNSIHATFDNPAATVITCVQVNNTSFTGSITNEGTITGTVTGAISLTAGTITGHIADSGVISSGGIVLDHASRITAATTAIAITGPTFVGGISNAGTIASANSDAINVNHVTTFLGSLANSGTITAALNGIKLGTDVVLGSASAGGGITNSGTIAAGVNGIFLNNVTTFLGGIINSGSISAAQTGIKVLDSGGATLLGGITNSGTISAARSGIFVQNLATFLGGISNSGRISAGVGRAGILVSSVTVFGSASAGGGITNTGTISAGGSGIAVFRVATFGGGISNAGTISAAGLTAISVGVVTTFFAGGITNSGQITGNNNGISVSARTFSGAIANNAGGTITTGGIGINVLGPNAAVFGSASAGIVNAGMISAGLNGIAVNGVTTFLGGIGNSGTIVAGAGHDGIFVTNVTTFLGGISNSGAISAGTGIKIGNAVTFAGGGAVVNSGTITGTVAAIDASGASSTVTIDQTGGLISGAINLSPNGDVLNITGGTIAGNVVGLGASDVVNIALGAGTFTYAAPFAMTGLHLANFNSGTAFVDGSIQATTIAVNNGGTAAGTGTLTGAVTVASGGTLMPGQPLGTLHVAGSLTFNPGSVYSVHVTPSANSATSVTGTASINGGTVLVTPQLGHYNATTYTIVSATGGRSGTFSALGVAGQFAFSGGASLSYDANDVFLNIGSGFVILAAQPGANVNQQNVLNGINNAILGNNPLPPGFQTLGNLSTPSLLGALTQLSGEVGASFSQGAFQAGNSFLNLMLDPFVDNRGRESGFGGNAGFGGAIGYAPGRSPPAASGAFASIYKAPPKESSDQRYSVWGAAYGGTGSVNGDPTVGSHNTSSQVYGFGGGFDYRVSPDTLVGLALAGGATNWSLDQGFGSGHSDMFQAGLFGSTHWGAAYLSGALAYSFHDVTTNRTVTVAGTDLLQANFRANVLSERVEGGYRVTSPWLALTPYAAVQVQSLFLPAYAEGATAGSAQFALAYAAQNQTTERTELGAWLDKSYQLDQGALMTFYGRAAWAHDFGNATRVSALFQTLPGSNFVVNGAKPASDGALVTAGAQYKLMNGWSFQAKFDGEFSSTTSIYSGTGVIRKEW